MTGFATRQWRRICRGVGQPSSVWFWIGGLWGTAGSAWLGPGRAAVMTAIYLVIDAVVLLVRLRKGNASFYEGNSEIRGETYRFTAWAQRTDR